MKEGFSCEYLQTRWALKRSNGLRLYSPSRQAKYFLIMDRRRLSIHVRLSLHVASNYESLGRDLDWNKTDLIVVVLCSIWSSRIQQWTTRTKIFFCTDILNTTPRSTGHSLLDLALIKTSWSEKKRSTQTFRVLRIELIIEPFFVPAATWQPQEFPRHLITMKGIEHSRKLIKKRSCVDKWRQRTRAVYNTRARTQAHSNRPPEKWRAAVIKWRPKTEAAEVKNWSRKSKYHNKK